MGDAITEAFSRLGANIYDKDCAAARDLAFLHAKFDSLLEALLRARNYADEFAGQADDAINIAEQLREQLKAEKATREAAEQRVREAEALPAKWRIEAGAETYGDDFEEGYACGRNKSANELEAALQGTGSGSADK